MKFKTILEGEQAVIYNNLGEGRLVVGPARVFLFNERCQKLRRITATLYEYMKIRDKDGVVTHKRGPCEVYFNPLLYEDITCMNAMKLDANHILVVYKRSKDGNVQRRIIQGPTVFVPEAEEWLHEFKWHGTDPSNKTRMVPGQDKFHELAIIPQQFYYNVRDVRTNDDTMITVKLMIFHQLKDVLVMLDATHDPIADMINAVCADVIAFVGKLSFEEFQNSSFDLSQMKTYPQLIQRAERVGFCVDKIVFRGYHASDQLQAMQNNAIESRTQLRLNTEIEEQRQRLADLKLTREQERSKLMQEMERSKQDHQQKKEDMTQQHRLYVEQARHQQKLLIQSSMGEAKLEHQEAENSHRIDHLTKLKDLDIDVTAYLTSRMRAPVTEELQVVQETTKIASEL